MRDQLFEYLRLPDDWHALEAASLEIKPEFVNCEEVLDEVSARLRSFAEAKGLGFEVLVPVTQIRIQTDRRALSCILLNLIDNAIKFTDRGSVSIQLRRRMRGSFETVFTEFSVEDSGPGIRLEEQAPLFKPFKEKGTGLPLSLRLAELLGGRIEMMSIRGQGSIFRLAIPGK